MILSYLSTLYQLKGKKSIDTGGGRPAKLPKQILFRWNLLRMDTNMSDFQKAFVRSRLARLPSEAPLILDEAEEETSNSFAAAHRDDDSSSASSASSVGTIVPSPGRNLFARSRGCVNAVPPLKDVAWAVASFGGITRQQSKSSLQ
jgi:hypothetical protein